MRVNTRVRRMVVDDFGSHDSKLYISRASKDTLVGLSTVPYTATAVLASVWTAAW
jgi:hypothetical protein